jgi:hypothetical protein
VVPVANHGGKREDAGRPKKGESRKNQVGQRQLEIAIKPRRIALTSRMRRRQRHDYTYALYFSELLRARRERPRRRAAEQCDKVAAFHCPVPPVLRTKGIAHLVTAALRDFNSPYVGLGSSSD